MRRSPINSIRTRLAVVFFLVAALSIAVVYLVVVPALTTGLQNQRLADLQQAVNNRKTPAVLGALEYLRGLPLHDPASKYVNTKAAFAANQLANLTASQVTVVDLAPTLNGAQPATPSSIAARPDPDENFTVEAWAQNVPASLSPQPSSLTATATGTLSSPQGPLGVVGIAVRQSGGLVRVVVFSVPNDVTSAVSLVRQRLLIAAGAALLVALLTGVLVARALTTRVLRLERIAQRVAQGDFEAHFGDSSGDELGQLARALAHMQRQLEGLDSARRRFIATASHELRTPIFSLGGFLELIQDEALDEETRRQFLSQVREQVDRLGKLATQLLDLTRLESGAVELAATTTDIGVLARAVSGEFLPALARHDSALSLHLPEEPIRVVCDPERIAQLLRILIDNALSHTPGGTDVVVTATPPSGDDGASLSVRDSGPGIPDAAIERVFEPFYSADGVRGAGLGLAIARELAVHMNARLEIDATPGSTTFTLTLPAGDP